MGGTDTDCNAFMFSHKMNWNASVFDISSRCLWQAVPSGVSPPNCRINLAPVRRYVNQAARICCEKQVALSADVELASKPDGFKLITFKNLRAPGPTIVTKESFFKMMRGLRPRVYIRQMFLPPSTPTLRTFLLQKSLMTSFLHRVVPFRFRSGRLPA